MRFIYWSNLRSTGFVIDCACNVLEARSRNQVVRTVPHCETLARSSRKRVGIYSYPISSAIYVLMKRVFESRSGFLRIIHARETMLSTNRFSYDREGLFKTLCRSTWNVFIMNPCICCTHGLDPCVIDNNSRWAGVSPLSKIFSILEHSCSFPTQLFMFWKSNSLSLILRSLLHSNFFLNNVYNRNFIYL